MVLPEITAGKVNEYRIHRCARFSKPLCATGWIDHLPDLSAPYRASAKISHRAWFSPEEYKQLYEATRKRAHDPKQPRFRWEAEQLHDYVLFSANNPMMDEWRRTSVRDG